MRPDDNIIDLLLERELRRGETILPERISQLWKMNKLSVGKEKQTSQPPEVAPLYFEDPALPPQNSEEGWYDHEWGFTPFKPS